MKVVILAAGASKRFISEGYSLPLPLLVTESSEGLSSIVQSCVDLATAISAKFEGSTPIVVCSPHVYLNIKNGPILVEAEYLQNGSAMSAYLASAHISLDEEVVFIEANSVYSNPEALAELIKAIPLMKNDVAVSYCIIPPEELSNFDIANYAGLTEGKPKRIVTPTNQDRDPSVVLTGIYYFNSLRKFQLGVLANARACLEQKLESTMALAAATACNYPTTFGVNFNAWTSLATPKLYKLAVTND